MRAYRESLSWLCIDPQATKLYSDRVRIAEPLITAAIEKFQLKPGKQLDNISDIDVVMADGVKFKFLDKPLTQEQLSALIHILPPGL